MSWLFSNLYRLLLHKGLRGRGILVRSWAWLNPNASQYYLAAPDIGEICVNLRSGMIVPLLDSIFGVGESALIKYMALFLRPGDVLWDVGANVGTISLHFSKNCFGLLQIEAFEPNPDLCDDLGRLFATRPKVRVHPIALGETQENAFLNLPPSMDSSMGTLLATKEGVTQIPISVTSGDLFMKAGGSIPTVIKIDVEGYESQVITGMRDLIATAQPVIFFEHLFLPVETVQMLMPPGYTRFFILDGGELTEDLVTGDWSHDSVLVPAGRHDELSALPIRRAIGN